MTDKKFAPIQPSDLLVGETIPGAIYIFIDLRYLIFRAKGDILERSVYERLELRKADNLFILASDEHKFKEWKARALARDASATLANPDLHKERVELHRVALDIFQSDHKNKAIIKAIAVSKQMAEEIMKLPYSAHALAQLQSFSANLANHSTNVSVLSAYLALRMGYSHLPILQYTATGGLLHDIGKMQVIIDPTDTPEAAEKKMQNHPLLGVEYLQSINKDLTEEVLLIIAQHHETHDGTGYPRKLRGTAIYDLAKIVSIANIFDGLVINSSGTLAARQKKAVKQLTDILFYNKFDPDKHEKAIKILEMGI